MHKKFNNSIRKRTDSSMTLYLKYTTNLPFSMEEARILTLDVNFLAIVQPKTKSIKVLETIIPGEMYIYHKIAKIVVG